MATNYIFPDSTCFFSQESLLNCIKDCNNDVLCIPAEWSLFTWQDLQMTNFSMIMQANCSNSELYNFEDVNINNNNNIYKNLKAEKELIKATVETLETLGLIHRLSFEPDGIEAFLKIKNLTRDTFYKKRLEFLRQGIATQNFLNVVISDIDPIVLSSLTGCNLETSNPKLKGYICEKMQLHENQHKVLEAYQTLSHVAVEDIEEYIDMPKKFITKLTDNFHEGHKKTGKLIVNKFVIDNIPILAQIKTAKEIVYELRDIKGKFSSDEKEHKVNLLRRTIKPVQKSILDVFSEYRLNIPPK